MTKNFKILRVVLGTICTCIGLCAIFFRFIPVDKSQYQVPENDLMTLTGYLIRAPKKFIESSSSYFIIELNTYPGADFQNRNIFLEATEWKKIIAEVKYHDTVSIKVLKSDFEKKYIKRDSMSFIEKVANLPYDKFEFYSFKFRDKEYVLDLYETAKQNRQDNKLTSSIIGFFFIGMGLYSYRAKK
jgi:hypothetical protein